MQWVTEINPYQYDLTLILLTTVDRSTVYTPMIVLTLYLARNPSVVDGQKGGQKAKGRRARIFFSQFSS